MIQLGVELHSAAFCRISKMSNMLELESKSESESETESALCNVLNRHPRRHQLELYLWPRHKTGPTSCRVGATASAMFLNEKRKKKNSGCEKNKIT